MGVPVVVAVRVGVRVGVAVGGTRRVGVRVGVRMSVGVSVGVDVLWKLGAATGNAALFSANNGGRVKCEDGQCLIQQQRQRGQQ